jgi:hypothetical protein
MDQNFEDIADELEQLVHEVRGMAAGAGTYPHIVAGDLRRIAGILDSDGREM